MSQIIILGRKWYRQFCFVLKVAVNIKD